MAKLVFFFMILSTFSSMFLPLLFFTDIYQCLLVSLFEHPTKETFIAVSLLMFDLVFYLCFISISSLLCLFEFYANLLAGMLSLFLCVPSWVTMFPCPNDIFCRNTKVEKHRTFIFLLSWPFLKLKLLEMCIRFISFYRHTLSSETYLAEVDCKFYNETFILWTCVGKFW